MVSTTAVRVVLADDHPVVRRGVRSVLDAAVGLEVVTEASDVPGALEAVRAHEPDVLVLDLTMPGGSSLDSIPTLRAAHPQTQIVILTMQNEPAYVRRALSGGALGYVVKDAASDELVEAIHCAARGESYVNPGLVRRTAGDPTS
jgi:two-component system, NarL family, response regulator NreC